MSEQNFETEDTYLIHVIPDVYILSALSPGEFIGICLNLKLGLPPVPGVGIEEICP
jgi:hypothetical protein